MMKSNVVGLQVVFTHKILIHQCFMRKVHIQHMVHQMLCPRVFHTVMVIQVAEIYPISHRMILIVMDTEVVSDQQLKYQIGQQA